MLIGSGLSSQQQKMLSKLETVLKVKRCAEFDSTGESLDFSHSLSLVENNFKLVSLKTSL